MHFNSLNIFYNEMNNMNNSKLHNKKSPIFVPS